MDNLETKVATSSSNYDDVLSGVVELLETARRTSARTTNAIMTATSWEVGRRIVECEQGGAKRAEYGETLMERLSNDLTHRFGRGFSFRNIHLMRSFYQGWRILQTPSAEFSRSPIFQKVSGKFDLSQIAARFPL